MYYKIFNNYNLNINKYLKVDENHCNKFFTIVRAHFHLGRLSNDNYFFSQYSRVF